MTSLYPTIHIMSETSEGSPSSSMTRRQAAPMPSRLDRLFDENVRPCGLRLPQDLGHVADVRDRPNRITKQKAPAVGALDPLRQFDHARVRDQRRSQYTEVFVEQDCGEHVKALGGEIAHRAKLPRIVVPRQPSSLDLVSHLSGVGCVCVAH